MAEVKKLLPFGGTKKLLPFGSSFFTLPTMPFSGLNSDPHQNDFRRINKQRVKRLRVWYKNGGFETVESKPGFMYNFVYISGIQLSLDGKLAQKRFVFR